MAGRIAHWARHRLKNAVIPLYLSFGRVNLASRPSDRVLYPNSCKPSISSFKMITGKLMLTRRAILLLCLLGHYSTLTVSQNVTITGGFFAANEPVSVVAANPTATTVAGTRIITVTFSGVSTTGTQVGTITETFVVGPSTAAYTEELPGCPRPIYRKREIYLYHSCCS